MLHLFPKRNFKIFFSNIIKTRVYSSPLHSGLAWVSGSPKSSKALIEINKKYEQNYSQENLDGKRYLTTDKDKDFEPEKRVNREKGGKTKSESIQEESYFHKEEVEQLKELKKKMKKEKQPDGNK